MPSDTVLARSQASLGRLAILGYGVTVALVGGLGVWAATTEVAGAIVATGSIVVEAGAQHVQHSEGGIVREILVENDQLVEAGQLLLRLDGTALEASLAVVRAQLDDALARRMRLVAEVEGQTSMKRPSDVPGWVPSVGFNELFSQQGRLLLSRSASLSGQKAQLQEQVTQIEEQIEGLVAQRGALSDQLTVLEDEWRDLSRLLEDGLTEAGRVNANKNQRAGMRGEIARIEADIAAARASTTERRMRSTQLDDEFRAGVLEELQQVNVSVAELLQQEIAAEDKLRRLEVRAPQAGAVHESKIRTVGGVVAAGDTLMLIVPGSSEILVDARVSPMDVDSVRSGQPVTLRLSSLDARLTPELTATVEGISPLTSVDPATGAPYYTVRVAVPPEELVDLAAGTRLVPGMPAEVFIETGDRTVLAYLAKPLIDQVMHTFREQ